MDRNKKSMSGQRGGLRIMTGLRAGVTLVELAAPKRIISDMTEGMVNPVCADACGQTLTEGIGQCQLASDGWARASCVVKHRNSYQSCLKEC